MLLFLFRENRFFFEFFLPKYICETFKVYGNTLTRDCRNSNNSESNDDYYYFRIHNGLRGTCS